MNVFSFPEVKKEYHGILGKSKVMQLMYELIQKVGETDIPVMICGESGTGKELVANAIHKVSSRKDKPFIKVNCSTFNENLLESELFGHVKGAYTGADKSRIGRFELANEGTIFLDEIGEISLSTQVKLLRVLEEKEIEKVGDNTPIKVDVRIVTATNKNLEDLIEKGLFRLDLFYRINVFPLRVPALRDRIEDIELLAKYFIKQNNKNLTISKDTIKKLMKMEWLGNIRELRNAIEYASIVCKNNEIKIEDFPEKLLMKNLNLHVSSTIKQVIDQLIQETMKRTNGNQTEASKILGISQPALSKRLKYSKPKNKEEKLGKIISL